MKGRRALVLGASAGLGFSIASELVKEGAWAAFLASEQAAFITGQSIVADGGWMRGF